MVLIFAQGQTMLNFIRQYWEKFCHAYAWAKFGWNDNSYDYTKIFDALVFKLKMHQKAMAEHHLHETGHEDAQDMGRAAELINSSINETHQLEAHEYIEEKYGALNFIFTDDKPYANLILKREKIETEAEEKEYKEESKKVYAEAELKDDQTLKEAFDLILNKYKNWWF